jgi:hypothetical protein
MTTMNAAREYLYRGPIRISETDMDLVCGGKKRCTIRRGIASITHPHTHLVSRSRKIPVVVERVETALFLADLTLAHARGEGFDTISELREDLMKYYPDMRDDEKITVIWFRPQ